MEGTTKGSGNVFIKPTNLMRALPLLTLLLLKTVSLLRPLWFSDSLVQSPCLFFVSAAPQHARYRRAADAQKPRRFLLIAFRIAQYPLQNQLRILLQLHLRRRRR